MQASTTGLVVGSFVWLEDSEEAWIEGEVLEIRGEDIKVLCTSGKKVSFLFLPLLICIQSFLSLNFYLCLFFFGP